MRYNPELSLETRRLLSKKLSYAAHMLQLGEEWDVRAVEDLKGRLVKKFITPDIARHRKQLEVRIQKFYGELSRSRLQIQQHLKIVAGLEKLRPVLVERLILKHTARLQQIPLPTLIRSKPFDPYDYFIKTLIIKQKYWALSKARDIRRDVEAEEAEALHKLRSQGLVGELLQEVYLDQVKSSLRKERLGYMLIAKVSNVLSVFVRIATGLDWFSTWSHPNEGKYLKRRYYSLARQIPKKSFGMEGGVAHAVKQSLSAFSTELRQLNHQLDQRKRAEALKILNLTKGLSRSKQNITVFNSRERERIRRKRFLISGHLKIAREKLRARRLSRIYKNIPEMDRFSSENLHLGLFEDFYFGGTNWDGELDDLQQKVLSQEAYKEQLLKDKLL